MPRISSCRSPWGPADRADAGTNAVDRVPRLLLGPCLYYFLVVGPGRVVDTPTILLVLMVGACIQGVLATVESVTHWNLWGSYHWDKISGTRAVSTFANPAVLGVYLGIGIVIAVAILTWHTNCHASVAAYGASYRRGVPSGPSRHALRAPRLRRPLSQWWRCSSSERSASRASALSPLLWSLSWPPGLTSKAHPSTRTGFRTSRRCSSARRYRRMSFDLAKQKPVLGWGFGSFERASATVQPPHIAGLAHRRLQAEQEKPQRVPHGSRGARRTWVASSVRSVHRYRHEGYSRARHRLPRTAGLSAQPAAHSWS